MPGRVFRSSRARPKPTGWRAGAVLSGLALLASCGPYDRAEQARAAEIEKLQRQTFAQAADEDRCAGISCAGQEAGFAYAKAHDVENPDACSGRGNADFVEGCRQYGQDIEEAYQRMAREG